MGRERRISTRRCGLKAPRCLVYRRNRLKQFEVERLDAISNQIWGCLPKSKWLSSSVPVYCLPHPIDPWSVARDDLERRYYVTQWIYMSKVKLSLEVGQYLGTEIADGWEIPLLVVLSDPSFRSWTLESPARSSPYFSECRQCAFPVRRTAALFHRRPS